MRKAKRKRFDMINVMVSDRLMKTKSEGKETSILDIIFFLSNKTVDDLEMELEKAVHGMSPTER